MRKLGPREKLLVEVQGEAAAAGEVEFKVHVVKGTRGAGASALGWGKKGTGPGARPISGRIWDENPSAGGGQGGCLCFSPIGSAMRALPSSG